MNSRQIAYECLCEVIQHGQYSNLIMRKKLNDLSIQDKGLVTTIVYGTLRNYRNVRYQWEKFCPNNLKTKIAILIDMSVYQLLFMDKIPEYAIVNEANNLVNKTQRKVVNAILRNVIKQQKIEPTNLAIKYSFPDWLYNLWKKQYPENYQEIMASFNQEARVYGRINTLKMSLEELKAIADIHILDEYSFYADFNLVNSDMFQEGKIVIQDYASAQIVKLLDLADKQNVLDCCSAPGTKASQIAMMLNNTGNIICLDIHEHRVNLIKQLFDRLNVTNAKALVADATKVKFEEKFDRILCDVPCSGLGTLKQKPEIKFNLQPTDLDEILIIQKNILQNVSQYLKVNGLMVYSTCTLNKKENEKQVELFLANNPNFRLVKQLVNFPYEEHGEGFYMAQIERMF